MEKSELFRVPLSPVGESVEDRPLHPVGQFGPYRRFAGFAGRLRHFDVHPHAEVARDVGEHRVVHHGGFRFAVHQSVLVERYVGVFHRPVDVVHRFVDVCPIVEHPLRVGSAVAPYVGDAHHGQSVSVRFAVAEVLVVVPEKFFCVLRRPVGYRDEHFRVFHRFVRDDAPVPRNPFAEHRQSVVRVIHQAFVQKIDRFLRFRQQIQVGEDSQRPVPRIHRSAIAVRLRNPGSEAVVPP